MAVCKSTQRIFQSLEPWEAPGNPSWWEGRLEPSPSRGQTAPVCPAVLAGPRYLENLRSWLGSGGQPSPQHV